MEKRLCADVDGADVVGACSLPTEKRLLVPALVAGADVPGVVAWLPRENRLGAAVDDEV